MEALVALLVAVGLIGAFDALAISFGADSRDLLGDDHSRPLGG